MGFPEAASGIEIEILRSLFPEADATLFTQMTPYLETPEAVGHPLGGARGGGCRGKAENARPGPRLRVGQGVARD
jgi:hypothetical protein